jgi:hypothetical protein
MISRLLRPFTGTGSVFFPVGLPPKGTCEFATPLCLKHCYVNDRSNFDEETRISYADKCQTYHLIMSKPIDMILERFLQDLIGLQTRILSWFGTGDCLTADTDRISTIVQAIPKTVIQMGFTRNQALWERHKDIFALSIEKEEDAPDSQAMYSIPDYEKETSVMYTPSYAVRGGHCGPILCRDSDRSRPELTHYINCKTCCRLQTGCFDRR